MKIPSTNIPDLPFSFYIFKGFFLCFLEEIEMDVLNTNSGSKEVHEKHILDKKIHEDFENYEIDELMSKKRE